MKRSPFGEQSGRPQLALVHDAAWYEAWPFAETNKPVSLEEGKLVCARLKVLAETRGFREHPGATLEISPVEVPTDLPLYGKLLVSAAYNDVDPAARSAYINLQTPNANGTTADIWVSIGAQADDITHCRRALVADGSVLEGTDEARNSITGGELLLAGNLLSDALGEPRLAQTLFHEEVLAAQRLGLPFRPNFPATSVSSSEA
jgi:hypothetical protein